MHELFIELVKLQNEVIAFGLKLFVILEGRDAAGKGRNDKKDHQTLKPGVNNSSGFGKPTDFQEREWQAIGKEQISKFNLFLQNKSDTNEE